MQRRSFLATGAAVAAAAGLPRGGSAQGGVPVAFDGAWQAVGFPRLAATRYGLRGRTLSIAADASSSLI